MKKMLFGALSAIAALALAACGTVDAGGVVFPNASSSYESVPLETLQAELEGMGFTNVRTSEVPNDLDPGHDGEITGFEVNGKADFAEGATFKANAPITLSCYGPYVTPIEITQSSDRHEEYIRNYRGMNAASFGYTSLGGDRRDWYGESTIVISFVTPNGEVADFTDEEVLKDYIVYGQNIEPNTKMDIAFETDSNGEEYDNLTSWEGYDEIVLNIKKLGEKDGDPIAMTPITQGDKHNRYVGDYVGRNLGTFGYTSWLGDRRVYVGGGNIVLKLIAEDGSYVDPSDYDSLNNYIVTAQSVAPNTPVSLSFDTDSNGKEFDNLGQASLSSIDLTVRRVG